MIIGVTGIPGSGKSQAVDVFCDYGFLSSSSDRLVREIYNNDETIRSQIGKKWGQQFFGEDGKFLFNRWRELIIDKEEALDWIEEIIHPKVQLLREEMLAKQPEKDWVLEIPLLFEKKLEKTCDLTVCISVGVAIQQQRLQERSQNRQLLEVLMKRQWPLARKESASDFVIYNNGSLKHLTDQIAYLIKKITP